MKVYFNTAGLLKRRTVGVPSAFVLGATSLAQHGGGGGIQHTAHVRFTVFLFSFKPVGLHAKKTKTVNPQCKAELKKKPSLHAL